MSKKDLYCINKQRFLYIIREIGVVINVSKMESEMKKVFLVVVVLCMLTSVLISLSIKDDKEAELPTCCLTICRNYLD